jgi:proteasome lid subunit RPN8/RPN11
MSPDEPIFEEEEPGADGGSFALPERSLYIGAVAEQAIPEEMPTIYLDFEVARQLQFEGQRSIKTDKEVAGILLGTTSHDNQAIKVSHIAIAVDEDSSPVHFKFTYSVWDDLIDQMERMSREAGEELLLLGWYHTHPNMSVFLSRYDLRTHRDFHRPYQFALVLAPKRGSADTGAGFFCNRGGETQLLPGLRVFGAGSRGEVTGSLPWKFQLIEAEGVEEGEEKPTDAAPVDDTPALQQLGVVRMEDADWLCLGVDKVEGPVLNILEGMAAAVVETHQDRLAVLLGTIDPNNHVTINRVRFLGHLGVDPDAERRELIGALRFMAQTFPASGEQKIVGVLRIVSPHQFKEGDRYDPTSNNIRIAQMLGEVGYDLDLVPFQVGIVLYPGVEEDTLFFQVFAQHKKSRPVPLMSLQAVAPPSLRANERYEPVGSAIFEVESDPCMIPPRIVPPSTIGMGGQSSRRSSMVDTAGDLPAMGTTRAVDPTGSGIDWDELPEEEERTGKKTSLVPLFLIIGGLLALVALLLVLKVLTGRSEGPDGVVTGTEAADLIEELGDPYVYSIVGCGAGWNPGVACRPFAGRPDDTARMDLVRLEKRPAYLEATIQPIEVWLVGAGSRRQRLVRRSEGDDIYVFSVQRGEGPWAALWGEGEEFDARLVVLPRGAEIELEDELSWLRKTERLTVQGPEPGEETPEEVEDPDPDVTAPVAEASWGWRSGLTREQASYDAHRTAFNKQLVVGGGASSSGTWRFRFRAEQRGAALATLTLDDLEIARGQVDVSGPLTRLMRDPVVVETLRAHGPDDGNVFGLVRPPGAARDLVVEIALTGEVAQTGVEHKVCVMLKAVDGGKLDGKARIKGAGLMRTTFDPKEGGGGECADGGATGRWTAATFGPGPTKLEFIYEGAEADYQAARGRVQEGQIPGKWGSGQAKCIAITAYLGLGGWQAQAPKLEPLYEYVDGKCQ